MPDEETESDEETELEYEGHDSRTDVADSLEAVADGLRGGGELEVPVGDRTVTVNPPETVEFEVEVEDEPEDEGIERSLEFELEWMRGEDEPNLSDSTAAGGETGSNEDSDANENEE